MSTKLAPADPPGRTTRKARAYSADIRRLRSQGYTFEAIRAALAAVGVDVSNRTVQREAARSPDKHAGMVDTFGHVTGHGHQPAPSRDESVRISKAEFAQPAASTSPTPRSGKAVAEEFRRSQCDNPLIRAKEQS
ncbi:hypothetical protein [Roseateles sp.]|uniref:hypothetical protein n=1 Tax=Roseateles sp. TaxID=1971397 RepID=UPI003BAA0664